MIWFLIAQAVLEYGQMGVDVFLTKNWTRAVIMACAGTSSIALTWMK